MPSARVCRPPLAEVLEVLAHDARARHARSVRVAVVSAILLLVAIAAASNNYELRRTNSWLDGTADRTVPVAATRDAPRIRLDVLAAPVAAPKLSADQLRTERASEGQDRQRAAKAHSDPATDRGKKIIAWLALMLRHGQGFR